MCLLFMDVADTSGTIDLDYMVEKLGIEKSKIDDLSNLLYKNYGTTMAGLRVWLSFFSLLIIGSDCWIQKSLITYVCFVSLSMQAIGYDFDYDEYHRYMIFFLFVFLISLRVL